MSWASVLRRVMALLATVLLVSVATFFAMRLVPGDPARLAAGQNAPAEAVEAMRVRLGLDRPLSVQLGRFLLGLATGDLGTSYRTNGPVWEDLKPRLLPTLLLTATGMGVALMLGVGAGLLSALAAPNRTLLSSVAAIEAPSDQELRIKTKEPFAPLLENLAHPGAAILPVGYDPQKPVGSGPYRLGERQNGVQLVLELNPNFGGTPPAWEQIVYKPVPEAASRSLVLESGDAQIVNRLAPEAVADLKNNSQVEVLVEPSTFQISFEINNRMKPFDDARVRRALNLAVDKEALVKGLLREMGSVPEGPVPDGAQWPLKLQAYPYSPDEAKRLLTEAGVQPGQPVEIWTTQGRYAKDKEMAEAVAGYLQAVGLAPEIKVIEWGTYVKAIEDPNKSAALYILGSSVPTLDWRLTRNFLSTSTNNYTGYKNEEVDRLLLEARTVFDDKTRQDLYSQVQTAVWEDAPYLFLFNQVQVIGVEKGLTGLTVYGHEILDFTGAKSAK